MRTKKNEDGYAILAMLLLSTALIIFLTAAIRLHYEWHNCNQKAITQLTGETSCIHTGAAQP